MKLSYFSSLLTLVTGILLASIGPVSAAPTGNYVELNGGSIRLEATVHNTPQQVSFDAWVKPSDTDGIHHILSAGNPSGGKIYYELSLNGSSLMLSYRHSGNSQRILSAGHVDAGVWSEVGFSIQSSESALYINGQKIASFAGAGNLAPIGPRISVGNGISDFGSSALRGAIDEVSLSVQNSPVILWHLDGVRGSTVASDSSGSGNHGSLVGSDRDIHYAGELPPQNGPSLPGGSWHRPLPTLSFDFPRPFLRPTITVPTIAPGDNDEETPPGSSGPGPIRPDIREGRPFRI